MANLNEAVQLIRQGHKGDARRILEPILKANPQDIQAWFWYVETFSTLEQRIKTLEICLKLNPGNPQALRALRALQARSENPPPAPPPTAQNEIPAWARRPAPEPVSPLNRSSPSRHLHLRLHLHRHRHSPSMNPSRNRLSPLPGRPVEAGSNLAESQSRLSAGIRWKRNRRRLERQPPKHPSRKRQNRSRADARSHFTGSGGGRSAHSR